MMINVIALASHQIKAHQKDYILSNNKNKKSSKLIKLRMK